MDAWMLHFDWLGALAGWWGLGWVVQSTVEIQIKRVYAVSRAAVFLPFSVEDAARSEAEVEASQVRYCAVQLLHTGATLVIKRRCKAQRNQVVSFKLRV